MTTPQNKPIRPLIVEYWQGADGQTYAHILSPNGKILMASEGYRRKQGVTRLYYALKRTGAAIVLRIKKVK